LRKIPFFFSCRIFYNKCRMHSWHNKKFVEVFIHLTVNYFVFLSDPIKKQIYCIIPKHHLFIADFVRAINEANLLQHPNYYLTNVLQFCKSHKRSKFNATSKIPLNYPICEFVKAINELNLLQKIPLKHKHKRSKFTATSKIQLTCN